MIRSLNMEGLLSPIRTSHCNRNWRGTLTTTQERILSDMKEKNRRTWHQSLTGKTCSINNNRSNSKDSTTNNNNRKSNNNKSNKIMHSTTFNKIIDRKDFRKNNKTKKNDKTSNIWTRLMLMIQPTSPQRKNSTTMALMHITNKRTICPRNSNSDNLNNSSSTNNSNFISNSSISNNNRHNDNDSITSIFTNSNRRKSIGSSNSWDRCNSNRNSNSSNNSNNNMKSTNTNKTTMSSSGNSSSFRNNNSLSNSNNKTTRTPNFSTKNFTANPVSTSPSTTISTQTTSPRSRKTLIKTLKSSRTIMPCSPNTHRVIKIIIKSRIIHRVVGRVVRVVKSMRSARGKLRMSLTRSSLGISIWTKVRPCPMRRVKRMKGPKKMVGWMRRKMTITMTASTCSPYKTSAPTSPQSPTNQAQTSNPHKECATCPQRILQSTAAPTGKAAEL